MGRGVVYGFINRSIMIIGAYVIHVYAGRALGPGLYGTFGVILSIMTIISIFLTNGVREAVSKGISTFPRSARRIYTTGIALQLGLSIPVSLAVFFSAGAMALFFDDARLLTPMRVCSVIILVHSLYFVHCGALNGLKKFLAEHTVGSTYSTVRPIAVVVLIGAGFGVSGAMWGFLAASLTATTIALFLLGRFTDDRTEVLDYRKIFVPAISNIVVFGAVTVMLNIDLFFVKRLIPDPAATGLYTAAAAFSKPGYWLAVGFGEVALPLVAARFAVGDLSQCRVYLSQVTRYAIIVFLPMIVIIACTAEKLIVLFYSQAYAQAHLSLSILAFGIWLVGLISIMAYIMIAVGRERLMAALALCAMALDIGLIVVLTPRLGLPGAALGTSLSALCLVLACGGYLARKIGLDFPLLSVVRIAGLAGALALAPGIPFLSQMPLLIQYILMYAGFAAALIIVGEIGPGDWAIVKGIVQIRGKSAGQAGEK